MVVSYGLGRTLDPAILNGANGTAAAQAEVAALLTDPSYRWERVGEGWVGEGRVLVWEARYLFGPPHTRRVLLPVNCVCVTTWQQPCAWLGIPVPP